MSWVEGVVYVAAIIGLCVIVDAVCATVRYWCGERQRRHYPMPAPPERSPTAPPGEE